MADTNVIVISGLMGTDVELTEVGDTHKASFRLGSQYVHGSGEKMEKKTTWVSVVLWSKLAQVVAEHCVKGQELTVTGRLVVDQYEKDGQKRNQTYIRGDQVKFGRKPGGTEAAPPISKDSLIKFLETVAVLEENAVSRPNAVEAAMRSLKLGEAPTKEAKE